MSAPTDFDLPKITYTSLLEVMQAAGAFVVKGIIECVATRKRPDGAPQKANAPSTVLAKGHDHPIFERIGRFMNPATYLVTPRSDTSVMITIGNPSNSEIAANLEDKGYDFFGITDKASDQAYDALDKYLCDRVVASFKGRRV